MLKLFVFATSHEGTDFQSYSGHLKHVKIKQEMFAKHVCPLKLKCHCDLDL